MTKRFAKLKFVAGSGQYGLNFPATDYVDHGIRLIRTTDLVGGTLASNENGIFVPEQAVSSGDKLLPGDLLLSRSGTIGRAFLAPSEAEGMAFAGFLVRFRPGPEVETQYLFYCTQSNDFQFAVHSDAVSSTIQNFNADRYNNIKIPLPPLDKQRAIADFLDQETAQIDALVAKQEEFIGLLRERRNAAWARGFSQAVQRHRLTPLRRVVTSIVDGPFGSSLTSAHYADSGTRVIRLGNIGVNTFRSEDEAYIPDTYGKQLSGHDARQGDVVIAGLGDEKWPLGRAAVVPDIGPAIVKADCFRARPTDGVTGEYLAWALSAPQTRAQVALMARGSTRQRINTSIARIIEVPVPPIIDQRSILALSNRELGRLDALISKAEEHIALAKERRSALITAAVTGQFDVRAAKKGARV